VVVFNPGGGKADMTIEEAILHLKDLYKLNPALCHQTIDAGEWSSSASKWRKHPEKKRYKTRMRGDDRMTMKDWMKAARSKDPVPYVGEEMERLRLSEEEEKGGGGQGGW